MRETRIKTIGSSVFRVQELGARDALRVLELVGRTFRDGMLHAIQIMSLGDVEAVIETFAPTTTVASEGSPPAPLDIGVQFAGHLLELAYWLEFCIEVNFAAYFKRAIDPETKRRRERARRRAQRPGFVKLDLPPNANWTIERVLVSERYKVSRVELETMWSFEDLMTAIDTLDALDEAESTARDKARMEHEARRPRMGRSR